MGLEDAVRKMNERTSEYDRLKAQAEQEDKARLIKLVEDFSSAIRRRGVAPIPIHATYTSTDGFTIVTPIVLGGGWMFTVSDEGGGGYLVVMTDGTLVSANHPRAIYPGEVRKFGIPLRFLPKGDFIGVDKDMESRLYGDTDAIEEGMIRFLARHQC